MNSRFWFWAGVLVASLVLSGICLRFLAIHHVSLSESLIARGFICVLMVIGFGSICRLSLVPKFIGTQTLRALLAGLALTFFAMSYNWLTASAVSVLSNVDVPLLVVLGPVFGVRTSWQARGLALFSILFLIWFVSGLEVHPHLFYGLSSLMLGTLLLCFGYLFIKKSMNEENEAVTIFVPSLALVAYGFAQYFLEGNVSTSWTPQLMFVAVLSGISMFGAYYATMRLYEQADLATAEFPTLVSSIVIQPFEAIFLDAPLQLSYVLSSVGFVIVIYFLLTWQNRTVASA